MHDILESGVEKYLRVMVGHLYWPIKTLGFAPKFVPFNVIKYFPAGDPYS
jgi:hypothetical protein